MSVRPAANARKFVRAPVGRYVAGRTWIACCPTGELAGFVLWGRPDAHDALGFLDVLPPSGTAFADKRARFLDLRLLEAPEPDAFAVFAGRVEEHTAHLGEIVSRAAVIHAGGLSGAIAEGFRSVVSTPFPVEMFTDPGPAFAWLGAPDPGPLFAELGALRERVSGETPLLRKLRHALGADLRGASLTSAASALGLSPRSLQRRLRQERSSFQGELKNARVEAAKHLLLESAAPIARVAREAGCASAHQLTTVFRETTGITPAAWRSEHKR